MIDLDLDLDPIERRKSYETIGRKAGSFSFSGDRVASTHPPGLCRKARYLSASSNAR